jgi:hypothetical protein
MVRNSFKPFFRGRFVERNGNVVLTGRFMMSWFAKAFLAVWFVGVVYFTVLSSFLAATHPQKAIAAPLFGAALFVAGVALVWVGKWFARNDTAWLSAVISSALAAQAPTQSGSFIGRVTSGSGFSRQSSTTITVVAAALVLTGIMCWAGAILGVQSVSAGPRGLTVTPLPNPLSRDVAAGIGAAVLLLAVGVYQRRLLAWRAGFGLLAAGWAYAVANIVANPMPGPWGVVIFFLVASLAVTAIWMRWWYGQRGHFGR